MSGESDLDQPLHQLHTFLPRRVDPRLAVLVDVGVDDAAPWCWRPESSREFSQHVVDLRAVVFEALEVEADARRCDDTLDQDVAPARARALTHASLKNLSDTVGV